MSHKYNDGILIHETLRVPQPMAELTSLIGDFIQYWGFKKIHGQIWSMIFLSREPIDATTLVKRLKVSKALISLAIKDLMDYEVVQIVGKGKRGKTLYQSHPDLVYVITQVLIKREKKMLENILSKQNEVRQFLNTTKEPVDICPEKLGELEDMVKSAQDMLNSLIDSGLSGVNV